jgi:catalase
MHLPVNAPKCPFATFQQDGHMATVNPVSRANYEPNSWGADEGGPREDPASGFHTYPAEEAGTKRRLRPESFADHYSQARQFYISQTGTEQRHIGDAFVFELSKCGKTAIRTRMVAGLRNVHDDLARYVADGLGLSELPDKAGAACRPITDLPASPALSILANGPESFAGRKIGALVAEGTDAALIADLQAAAEQEGAMVELVAPAVGGVETSDGKRVEADQQIDGGPSVLYDAVVLLLSAAGASELARHPAARDFVTDAYAHYKFIGYTGDAAPLLDATGISELRDGGFIELSGNGSAGGFISACRQIRFWEREAAV